MAKKIKVKKPRAKKAPKITLAKLTAQVTDLCSSVERENTIERKKSWELFIAKLHTAVTTGRPLVCVTSNPEILENKSILEETYNCQIVTPTEARYGCDYINY